MIACKPYGNPKQAQVFVIGHDPLLQRSEAKAETAFYLDYLERDYPTRQGERRKYELARAVVDYIRHLAGGSLELKDMYVTNPSNTFLPRPRSGTVLIPDSAADRGIHEIEQAVREARLEGLPKVILPMSLQVFYHLVRSGFVTETDDNLKLFLEKAQPRPKAVKEKLSYEPMGKSPFLRVCGQMYHHRDDMIPVVPILHVKQWPLKPRMGRYAPLMDLAAKNVRSCLGVE